MYVYVFRCGCYTIAIGSSIYTRGYVEYRSLRTTVVRYISVSVFVSHFLSLSFSLSFSLFLCTGTMMFLFAIPWFCFFIAFYLFSIFFLFAAVLFYRDSLRHSSENILYFFPLLYREFVPRLFGSSFVILRAGFSTEFVPFSCSIVLEGFLLSN